MAKGSQFEDLAAQAARNIDVARAAGEQLTLLPDEAGPVAAQGDGQRPPRGKGKITSQLRDFCAAKGYRMPEDVLIQMAGMASREDVFLFAMQRTEQILAWAEAGARKTAQVIRDGALIEVQLDTSATMAQRVQTFQTVYAAALKAADSLLPYGLGKVTPDASPTTIVPVFVASPVQGAAPRAGDQARDVTPQDRRIGPPPMPGSGPMQAQQNQGVSRPAADQSDGDSRTEGATR
jgi:hypothetical protein